MVNLRKLSLKIDALLKLSSTDVPNSEVIKSVVFKSFHTNKRRWLPVDRTVEVLKKNDNKVLEL